jgi:anti-sigma regulatory factor (Ser/Thr protein kinase)
MSDDAGRPATPPGRSSAAGEAAASAAAVPRADGSLILEQPFGSDSLYALRAAVAAHAARAGVPAGQVPDLVIAVHELATNAIRHGAGHGRLRVWAGGGALHCQVSDDGTVPAAEAVAAAPATSAADPGMSPADPAPSVAEPSSAPGGAQTGIGTGAAAWWPAEHGHGLWLIRQVADQTTVHSGPAGTVATVSFMLPGRPG